MLDIGRNDLCPCGSGKKFKKCHMGREEELVLEKMNYLPEGTAEKIVALPEVNFGKCRDLVASLDLEKLTNSSVGIKFIDLREYNRFGFIKKETHADLNRVSAGMMVNPMKTLEKDSSNIYIAVSPAVSRSTLIHQIAHAIDYIAGSKLNPARAGALGMELGIPAELVEHPKEFGEWLVFLSNELGVELDAEDTIIAYLNEQGRLIPGEILNAEDTDEIKSHAMRTLTFMNGNRREIDKLIKEKEGYLGDLRAGAENKPADE